MAMFLGVFVMKLGKIQLNFMEQVKTFCLLLSMEISQLFIIGLVLIIKCNGEIQHLLVWVEDLMADLAYI